MTIALEGLREVGPDVLTGRLYELRRSERLMLVEFLTVLAELDRRNAVVGLGFSSVFDFLQRHLGYSKAASFRRKEAARLLARFPVVGEYLADGRLCLTTLVELRDVLTEENLGQVLDRAAGRTEDDVKLLVASLAPKPAPPELFRRLPAKQVIGSGRSRPDTSVRVRPETSVTVHSVRCPGRGRTRCVSVSCLSARRRRARAPSRAYVQRSG